MAGCELIALSIIAFLKNRRFFKEIYPECSPAFKIIEKLLEYLSYSIWRTNTILI
jgi:hypothetical protein